MFSRRFVTMCLFIATACAGTAAFAAPRTVEGSVTYLERIAVSPGAVLEVEVLDVSRADAPSIRMAAQRYALDRVPFAFSLTVDDALIDDRFSYVVAAKVLLDETVVYRSTTAYPVLTRNAPDRVDIVVDRMPAAGDAPVLDGTWQASQLHGTPITVDNPPTLRFSPDGALAAFGGCNRYRGQVETAGDTLTFPDNMAGTLMACPEPTASLEREFLMGLSEVVRFEQSASHMVFFDAVGETVMRLTKDQ